MAILLGFCSALGESRKELLQHKCATQQSMNRIPAARYKKIFIKDCLAPRYKKQKLNHRVQIELFVIILVMRRPISRSIFLCLKVLDPRCNWE